MVVAGALVIKLYDYCTRTTLAPTKDTDSVTQMTSKPSSTRFSVSELGRAQICCSDSVARTQSKDVDSQVYCACATSCPMLG